MEDHSGDGLRVVLFTDIPGGHVYRLADETLRNLGHRIVGVVTTPGPRRRRSTSYLDVVAAVRPGIDVIVSSHPNRLAAMLAPLQPDLILSGGFTWLLPPEVIALPRRGAINMHPSPLPRYRGPHSIEWALRNDDSEAGFTIHRLDAGFDTGRILAQGMIPIHDDDDAQAIIARFFGIVPGLLATAITRVAAGEAGEPQDEAKATYAGAFEDAWRTIDWTRSVRTIHAQVRSWTGFRGMPLGAIGEIDRTTVTILRTRILDHPSGTSALPGTVLLRETGRMVVQCGDGPIAITGWLPNDAEEQGEGGTG